MAKRSLKDDSSIDIAVLGEHPSSYLTAALLRHDAKLRVLHLSIPGEEIPERLVTINPDFFDLHPLFETLQKKISLSPIFGLRFFADEPQTSSEYTAKAPVAFVSRYKNVREECCKLAESTGVEFEKPKTISFSTPDQTGVNIVINKTVRHATMVIVAGSISAVDKLTLGIPGGWGGEVVHRYTFVRCKNNKQIDFGPKPLMPMSLDLSGQLLWAWLIPGDGEIQIAVEQPIETMNKIDSTKLLQKWVEVLKAHRVLGSRFEFQPSAVQSIDLPLAGALESEGVANRTVLVGPAGGFYSACAEDIYPNCWSAVFAANVIKKALKETHLQDALAPYRQQWRTTLGDYLRGPQQNLRFLLPLVYRNPAMASRLADAILFSKSVVR